MFVGGKREIRAQGGMRAQRGEEKKREVDGWVGGGREAAEAEPSTSHQPRPRLSFYQLQTEPRTCSRGRETEKKN